MAPEKKPALRFSSKAVLFLLLAAIAGLFLYAVKVKAPALAKTQIETMLKKTGFAYVEAGRLDLGVTGLVAHDIKLDEYGFDKIDTLTARFNWLPFLFHGTVSQVMIDGVGIGRDAANLGPSMRQLGSNLLNIPPYRIDISKAVIDLGTAYGEIQVTADISVTPVSETEPRQLKALIRSEQFQLGFDSDWQGTIARDGSLDLSGKIDSGRINVGPLRVSRFNGWVAIASGTEGFTGQSQMEAGSATFMDMPLEKLSLVADHSKGVDNVLFRSGMSGMKDVLFTSDYTRANDVVSFSSILKGHNLASFLDYIEEATGHDKTILDPLLAQEPFQLVAAYQPDRGFVGGPLPFTLALNQDGRKTLDGNILFYPDTLDLRGALETSPEMAVALQEYFKIPSANVNQNFIRLDGAAKRFFMFGERDKLTGDALVNGSGIDAPDKASVIGDGDGVAPVMNATPLPPEKEQY